MVLEIGVTFQIIEALSTTIDSMIGLVNSKTWHAGGEATVRKEKCLLYSLIESVKNKQL